jgi:hypothetical protein
LSDEHFASAADAAGLGGIVGFNEGNSLQDRAANAGQGGNSPFFLAPMNVRQNNFLFV